MYAIRSYYVYMGETAEANPIPRPPIKRYTMNKVKLLTAPVPIAEMVNKAAAMMSKSFLPKRSAKTPEAKAPRKHLV